MNFDDIWKKIEGKTNLLFLIRSEHNKTFGGYVKKLLVQGESIKDEDSFAFQ